MNTQTVKPGQVAVGDTLVLSRVDPDTFRVIDYEATVTEAKSVGHNQYLLRFDGNQEPYYYSSRAVLTRVERAS